MDENRVNATGSRGNGGERGETEQAAQTEHPRPEGADYAEGVERRPDPLWELTLARLREFLREPEAVFWVFVFPVLLAVALGIAFREQAPERARVAVESTGRPAQQELAARLRADPGLAVSLLAPGEASRALRTGKVDIVLALQSEAPASVQAVPMVVYRFDPARGEARSARLATDAAVQRAHGRTDPVPARDEAVQELGWRYIDYLIPGLIGLNLMGSGLWGIGFNVVYVRTRKLLKRFVATPMNRAHFLLSFMLSRLVLLVLEMVALVGFGWLLFGVAVHGSILDLAIVVLLGALAFAGLGLLVAARAKTTEGVSGWMNLVQLPMWLLSGAFFSYERFPEAIQPLIRVLPLTALNDALRAVMNEGLPLAARWPEVLLLTAWTVGTFVVALRVFRWQ